MFGAGTQTDPVSEAINCPKEQQDRLRRLSKHTKFIVRQDYCITYAILIS